MNNSLTVVILSRDRPNYLEQTISCILKQTFKPNAIIVSDNSVQSKTIKSIEQKYKNIKFIYRGGLLSWTQHITKVISECESDFIHIAFDDDLIQPEFLKLTVNELNHNPDISAVATNGILFKENKIIKNYFFKIKKNSLIIEAKNLLIRYLDKDLGGVAPFSSYVYRISSLKNQSTSIFPRYSEGRNYADTIFLYRLSSYKKILWLNRNLIKVRDHPNTNSYNSGVDYKAFIISLRKLKITDINIEIGIKKYRFFNFLAFRRFKKSKRSLLLALKCGLYLFIHSSYFRKALQRRFFKKFIF